MRKTELESNLFHFSSVNIWSYFIYTDLISSLLNTRLVDPGSTLIYVDTFGSKNLISQ